MGYIIEWDKGLATQPTLPPNRPDPVLPRVYPSPLARLPGPNGTASAWGLMDVRDLGGPAHIKHAVSMLLSGEGTRVNGTAARFDIHDPEDGGNQGAIPGQQIPMASDTPGIADDNFVSVVKGTISVAPGQGGDYTFNVHSDDGFALRLLSQATLAAPLTQHKFTAQQGGFIDEDGTLVFAFGTGDSNTQGVVNLQPGTYDVEFTTWDGCCGTFWEVSTAKGNFVGGNYAQVPQWKLLGDGSSVAGTGPFPQPAKLVGQAKVENYDDTDDIFTAIAVYRGTPTVSAMSNVDDVVLNGDGGLGIFGSTVGASFVHQFPNGTGLDNFSTAVTGTLQVLDTDGAPGETLTFGLFSDDNAALHIVGEDFTAAVGDGNTALGTPDGADIWLTADFATGNTNARGLISLMEGEYDFEAFQLEMGGGAALEVWVASGDRTASGFGSGAFHPLSIDALPARGLAANTGLALVAGPGTGPTGGLGGDFNADGRVDGQDFLVWQRGGSPNPVSAGDLALWKANFGATSAGTSAGAVPEPAALGLALVAGLAVLAARRRR